MNNEIAEKESNDIELYLKDPGDSEVIRKFVNKDHLAKEIAFAALFNYFPATLQEYQEYEKRPSLIF